MRLMASILGTLVLLANLACAAMCCLPEAAAPPCHQQQETAKACDQQSWADGASKLVMPAAEAGVVLAVPAARVLSPARVALVRPLATSPPLILRI